MHDREDLLYDKYIAHYKTLNLEETLCFDGLCYNGCLYNDDCNTKIGNEEHLWRTTNRKILFLMKDPNNNPDQDYREWGWSSFTHPTFKTIFAWLKGLSSITTDEYTPLENAYQKYDKLNPLVIVNLKKSSGGSSVSNSTLWEYAMQDQHLLKEQIRDILKPNIIVCGGGSGTVLNIAKSVIFEDITFEQFNNWCHYSSEHNLLLIDSYHPKARISLERRYDGMMHNVKDFLAKCPDFLDFLNNNKG